MPLVHSLPLKLLNVWREADIQTVENHLRKCDRPFRECFPCACIVVLVSEGHFCVLPGNDWKEGLSELSS